ncbi:hypothetical protein ACTFIW_005428 [Dictyostelium discoideum]
MPCSPPCNILRASKGRRKTHSGDSVFIQNEGKPLDDKEVNIIVLSTLSSSEGVDDDRDDNFNDEIVDDSQAEKIKAVILPELRSYSKYDFKDRSSLLFTVKVKAIVPIVINQITRHMISLSTSSLSHVSSSIDQNNDIRLKIEQ